MKHPLHKIFWLATVLFFICSIKTLSQTYSFSQYSLEEGLPQSEVMAITEDHLGYMWVGTNGGGLCRFDGNSFDVFTRKNGLYDNMISGLFQDDNYDLWIGSPRAILRYDGKTFNRVFVSDSVVFVDEMRFFESSGGNIWLQTNLSNGKRGFFRIKNDSLVNACDLFDEISDDNQVFFVTRLNNNHFIVTTEKGYFDLRSDKLIPSGIISFSESKLYIPLQSDRKNNIWALAFDRKNYDRKLQIISSSGKIKDAVLPKGISAQSIVNSYQDREGGIWFCIFEQGVIRYLNGKWHTYDKRNGLQINSVKTVHEDAEGNFWFGTLGGGLVRFSGDLFTTFNSRSGLADDFVRSIYQDSKGIYYFGDGSGVLNIYDGKSIRKAARKGKGQKGYISSMYEIKPGVLLLGTLTGLYEFNGKTFSACNKKYGLKYPVPVMDIESNGDTLFFATYRSGVIKSINGKSTVYDNHTSNYNAIATNDIFLDSKKRLWICSDKGIWLYNGDITSVNKKYDIDVSYLLQAAEDKYGNIWFATYTDGLLKYNGKRFDVFDSSDGLTSDNIYSVICDNDGNIWAGTQNGVDRLTLNNNGDVTAIDNFGRYDGFTGIENNGKANFKDHEGNLWFGTIKGAIRYDPSKKRTNYLPPPVYISKLEIGLKQVNWAAPAYRNIYDSIAPWLNIPVKLKLPHDLNHISFSFDGLCYTVPEKVMYKWKLEPAEENYLPATKLNKAVYSSLPPGNYTFYVKACNNSGIWNETPAVFSFTIKPAWWQTTILKIAILLIFLGIAGLISMAWHKRNLLFKNEMQTLINSKSSEIQKQKETISQKEAELHEQEKKLNTLTGRIEAYRQNIKTLALLGDSALSGISVEHGFMNSYKDVSEVMDTYLYGLGILNTRTSSLVFENVIIKGERAPVSKFPLDDIERLSVHSLINDKIIFIKSLKDEYRNYVKELRPIPGDINSHSIIFIPLKTKNSIIGVLTVQSAKTDAYNEYHLDFMRVVADFLAIVISEKTHE